MMFEDRKHADLVPSSELVTMIQIWYTSGGLVQRRPQARHTNYVKCNNKFMKYTMRQYGCVGGGG